MITNIKDLTKEYKHLMQDLHFTFGYDFKKPFTFYGIDGKFTINKLHLPDDAKTVIMIKPKAGAHFCCPDDLRLVLYDKYSNGGFTVDGTRSRKYYGHENRKPTTYDDIYRKGEFEDLRKSGETETWILTQDKKYITCPMANIPFNKEDRFKVKSRYSDTITPDTNSSSCDFIPYGYNGGTVNYNRYVAPIKHILDKSGYMVIYKRNDLEQRAEQVRRQKAKDAYLKTDNTDKVNTLARLIKQYKRKLSEQVLDVKTIGDVNRIDRLIGWAGLYSIIDDFRDFKKNTEHKSFNSIQESNNLYDRINKRIHEYL